MGVENVVFLSGQVWRFKEPGSICYVNIQSAAVYPSPSPPGHLNHMSYQYLYNISGQITTVKPLLTDTSVYNLDTSLSWI